MANFQRIELRTPNPLDYANQDYGEDILRLKNDNQAIWIWDIILNIEAPDVAAEIRVDFTDDFDNGETTAIVLYVIGVNAQDKAEGTGAREVTIFGYGPLRQPQQEAVTLHATAATQIASALTWTRFVGAMVTKTGSGGLNVGAITVTSTGQAETYGTIAAAQMCTIGPRVYIPTGLTGYIAYLAGKCTIEVHATDEAVYGDGYIIKPTFLKSAAAAGLTETIADTYFISTDDKGFKNLNVPKILVAGANTYYITYLLSAKAADANMSGLTRMIIIVYKLAVS